jgi:hypothetical protein
MFVFGMFLFDAFSPTRIASMRIYWTHMESRKARFLKAGPDETRLAGRAQIVSR